MYEPPESLTEIFVKNFNALPVNTTVMSLNIYNVGYMKLLSLMIDEKQQQYFSAHNKVQMCVDFLYSNDKQQYVPSINIPVSEQNLIPLVLEFHNYYSSKYKKEIHDYELAKEKAHKDKKPKKRQTKLN